jgi:spermidine synthase
LSAETVVARTSEGLDLRIDRRWFFMFFVFSGFCGLVYEVVWLRLAMASFGVTSALASIVISMFMAGLGVGSWASGVLIHRRLTTNGRTALRLYSLTELLIGISSIAVPAQLKLGRVILEKANFGAWQSLTFYVFAGFWIAITLVPWCACMGATFPFLMAAIRQTSADFSKRSFSYLYLANVIGALAGTLVSAFILIELLGFQGTLFVAGALNLDIALLAFGLSLRVSAVQEQSVPADDGARNTDHGGSLDIHGLPRSLILLALFVTGFVSMGLEVIWIRQYTPYLGNLVYSFAAILSVYLMSTAVGSFLYRRWTASQTSRSSVWDWSLLALGAVLPVFAVDPTLPFMNYERDPLRIFAIVVFSAVAGFITPSLVDSWSSGSPDRAGSAYAVNVAGSIVGPLVAGFILLPRFAERHATVLLAFPLFIIAGMTAFRFRTPGESRWSMPKLRFVVAVVAAFSIVGFSHDYETRFPTREVRRDYTATVVAVGTGLQKEILVNGVGMTTTTPITKYMAHLPLATMSRPPKNGLVICFGMGTSFRSMLSWGIPTTAVDLVPSVPKLFGYFHSDAAKIESSPLARIVVDDGRRFLDNSTEKFDVIVVDPPPPTPAPGSSLLYSIEFYDVIKKHLSEDGILQAWYPSSIGDAATRVAVTKSILLSFKYVRVYGSAGDFGVHYLASMKPIPQRSSAELASRLPPAAAADFIEWGPARDPQQQFQVVVGKEFSPEELLVGAPRAPALRDDRPVNEYFLMRAFFKNMYR